MDFPNSLKEKLKNLSAKRLKKKMRKTLNQDDPYTRPEDEKKVDLPKKGGVFGYEESKKMTDEANEAMKKYLKSKHKKRR